MTVNGKLCAVSWLMKASRRALVRASVSASDRPSSFTSPALGVSSPERSRRSVVLPGAVRANDTHQLPPLEVEVDAVDDRGLPCPPHESAGTAVNRLRIKPGRDISRSGQTYLCQVVPKFVKIR